MPRRLAIHCLRRLGWDRNPLRRATDRAESAVRLAAVAAIIAAAPAAALSTGHWAGHAARQQIRAEAAAIHPVQATLTQRAPRPGDPDPYTGYEVSRAAARWTGPHGAAHTGDVLALAGAARGTVVAVWTDGSGNITTPPPEPSQADGDIFIAGTVGALGAVLALLAAEALILHLLDRRRLDAWEAEWRAVAPRWTGHRT